MKKIVTVLAATAILSGGTVVAQEYKNQIKARQGTMWVIALNLGTLGAMAKGEAEYDAEAATTAAEAFGERPGMTACRREALMGCFGSTSLTNFTSWVLLAWLMKGFESALPAMPRLSERVSSWPLLGTRRRMRLRPQVICPGRL